MGQQGLFYYYQTFARTMSALGEDEFVDDSGRNTSGKMNFNGYRGKRQEKNGSWLNDADRWYEKRIYRIFVTAYCLIALALCEE